MLVISSPSRQRQHAPLAEIEASGFHDPFEHPGRADAIHQVLAQHSSYHLVEPDRWGTAPIEAVHDPDLVRFLASAWAEYQHAHPGTHDVVPDVFRLPGLMDGIGPFRSHRDIDTELGRWCFETTTPLTEGTFEAATSAVDVALTAAAAALGGERAVYGLCRPPGHHAPTALYGGYCFFNNAAVAAHHVACITGSRVSILDVDYHHGNGTQQIFYRRDDVQYVSIHGDPVRAYPYITGFADEVGAGPGRAANVNIPMPRGATDEMYADALGQALHAIDQFRPDLLVVSLGVDAFHNDPISDLAVTADGFEAQGALVAQLDVPTVVVQEGGYDVAALGDNVHRWLSGLGGPGAVAAAEPA